MQDVYIKCYLLFLKYALNFINSFNALFQSRYVLIHKLYDESQKILTQICGNFVKVEICLEKDLSKVNLKHPDCHLPLNAIIVGIECSKMLDVLSAQDKENFRKKCLLFYITAATEIQDRLPIQNDFFLKTYASLIPILPLIRSYVLIRESVLTK
jgi:hypothetical protein